MRHCVILSTRLAPDYVSKCTCLLAFAAQTPRYQTMNQRVLQRLIDHKNFCWDDTLYSTANHAMTVYFTLPPRLKPATPRC